MYPKMLIGNILICYKDICESQKQLIWQIQNIMKNGQSGDWAPWTIFFGPKIWGESLSALMMSHQFLTSLLWFVTFKTYLQVKFVYPW